MMNNDKKQVEFLVVDTTAFIQNAALYDAAKTIVTCQEVVDEITNKRQLRRLITLPYDLIIKNVFPEYIQLVTEFSKKTGDYPSLSSTDIKVLALTYQLEKEHVGIDHIRTEPVLQRPIINMETPLEKDTANITGFFQPGEVKTVIEAEKSDEDELKKDTVDTTENDLADSDLQEKFETLNFNETNVNSEDILVSITDSNEEEEISSNDDDDDIGWITPSNVKQAKKEVDSQLADDQQVVVACMTTDFAMQNVLKQMNLNVSALDGRIIKQLRTYILRCYTCFKTTSIMTKKFCPKCGNNTLKKVAVSVRENGEMQIHINARRPLTGRGKKFSLPRIKGGKHPNNPILVADQPMADNKPSRLARTKNNPLDDDYIAGYSPFIMRDVNSKSAQLGIRPGVEFKQWMKKNPNESRRRRK